MIITAVFILVGLGIIIFHRRLTLLTSRLKHQSPSASDFNLYKTQYYIGGFLLISMGLMRLFLW